MTYSFEKQYRIGKTAEYILDRLLVSKGYSIEMVGRSEERNGIDRVLTSADNRTINAEYKTDRWAYHTGNAYMETVAYDNGITSKKGWVFTSKADVVLYWVHPGERNATSWVYVLDPKKLRTADWFSGGKYEEKTVKNTGFFGKGILVPMAIVRKLAGIAVLKMPKEFLSDCSDRGNGPGGVIPDAGGGVATANRRETVSASDVGRIDNEVKHSNPDKRDRIKGQ